MEVFFIRPVSPKRSRTANSPPDGVMNDPKPGEKIRLRRRQAARLIAGFTRLHPIPTPGEGQIRGGAA